MCLKFCITINYYLLTLFEHFVHLTFGCKNEIRLYKTNLKTLSFVFEFYHRSTGANKTSHLKQLCSTLFSKLKR